MASLLIVLSNTQGLPQSLSLLDLCLRQLMHLMIFQTARIRSSVFPFFAFGFEFLPQTGATVIDLILIDTRTW
jgi:hypothetical protein